MAAKKSRRTPASRRRSSPKRKPFDMALIQRGARLRRSPFFDKSLEAGCKSYTVYNHTFLPSYYSDPVTEYWHLLKDVALWDVAVERNVPQGDVFQEVPVFRHGVGVVARQERVVVDRVRLAARLEALVEERGPPEARAALDERHVERLPFRR